MKAIVLADGDAPDRAGLDTAWPDWSHGIDLVVAADGGSRLAAPLGLALDAWVGDGDSTGDEALAAIAASGITVRRVDAAKDESDTELAVLEAVERGADEIIILGALGGPRFDHAFANIGLLAMWQLAGRRVALLDERTRIRLVAAPDASGDPVRLPLPGRVDELVSLLPFGSGVAGVTTDGLAYPLDDEPLPPGPARGLSNVRSSASAAVTVRSGRLLVIETPATLVE